jgi:hypothetical protein
MAITLLQMAEKVLEEEKRALYTWEIWQVAKNKGYDKLVESQEKTGSTSLKELILVDISGNPSSVFVAFGEGPTRFILKSQLDNLRPGTKVRVLEHYFYDIDDIRVADVVATKGSIGTILYFEERNIIKMIKRYTIRLDEIAPLSKDDYNNFVKKGYISAIVSCHVGFDVVLPLETFALI